MWRSTSHIIRTAVPAISTTSTRALSSVTAQKQQAHQDPSSSSTTNPFTSAGVVAALLGAAALTAQNNHTVTNTESNTTTNLAHCVAASNAPHAHMRTHAEQAAVNAAMGKLRSQFSCPLIVLNKLADRMNVEMKKGLISTEGSQIKMLPSYVNHLPTGQENGEFLALDLGGSNFRVVTFRLEANKGVTMVDSRKVTIPASLMTDESHAKDLFGFIADQVGEAPGANDFTTPDLNLGFTCSFPVDQKSINRGILLHWTKGFATKGCVGEEIVNLLQKELRLRGISVNVSALVNDTVGTLVANTLDDPNTHVGVILGTGCNACYTEKTANIVKMTNNSTEVEADDEMVSDNI